MTFEEPVKMIVIAYGKGICCLLQMMQMELELRNSLNMGNSD